MDKLENDGKYIKLKDVKMHDFFRLKENSKTVFMKQDYDRYCKAFDCVVYESSNLNSADRHIKSTKLVYANFTY